MSAFPKTLRKNRLEGFLERLLEERRVLAPLRKGGLVVLQTVDFGRDVVLDYENTKEPPKFVFFPQRETLFRYRSEKDGVLLEAASGQEKGQVLFGIRPCDARGLLLLDGVFGGDCADPYYADKRSETVVASLGCRKPNLACFCHATGGGPCSPEGSDLFFLDLGDRYLVEAVTDRGAALLEGGGFDDADEEALALGEKIKRDATAFMEPLAWAANLEERLARRFNDPAWSALAETCLGCGICTYLCPTCHCFDLCDEGTGFAGERIRVWDSCQFPLFTQQASGFNPRPTVKERFRQRIMHKFSYLPETQGRLGCVGCGRCITECPVNLDIREAITSLAEGNLR